MLTKRSVGPLVRLVVALLVAIVGACSLVTDLSGLSGDPPLVGVSDASLEAQPAEAAVRDAGPEVRDAVGFCSRSDADFCDDFDTKDLSALWNTLASTLGSIQHDPSDAAPSSPNTLFAEIAAVSDASVSRAANVGKTFAMPATHLAVSFAMRIDTMDTAANASLRWLSLVSNDDGSTVPFHRLYLTTVGSSDGTSKTSVTEGVKLVDGGQFFGTRSLSRSPKLGEWVRFDLAVDLPVGGPGSLVIQLDGTVVVTYPLEAAWTLAFLKTLTVGEIFAFSSAGAWRVRFDDLEVRTR